MVSSTGSAPHLTITLQGLPTIAGQGNTPPVFNPNAPQLVVASNPDAPVLPTMVQRLPAVRVPDYAQSRISEIQRERLELLDMFEARHNLPVADFAKLMGKSRRAVSYDIQAGKLLSIHLGNRGQRVPDWQLDPLKRKLTQTVLKEMPLGMDGWRVYRALLQSYDELGKRPAIEAVCQKNLHRAARLVAERVMETDTLDAIAQMPMQGPIHMMLD